MASPVVAGTAESATTTAGTNHVLNWTGLGTVAAGDLLIIILDKGSTAATVNAHADWTELLDDNLANGLYIAYRWATGGETAPTLVTSASTRSAEITYRITGAINPAAQAPQIGTTATGTSATPDPPASAAPGSTQDYLFIAFYGAAGEEADDDTWSDTPPTNYTPSPPRQKSCGVAGTNLGGLIAAAERALNTGAAENPGTFAKDVSVAWRSQTIMVSPANPQIVTPGIATLTLTTFAPTVTTTNHQVVTPGVASLTLSTFAPTVTVGSPNITVTPGTASLAISTFAPVVTATNHQTVIPGVATLTISTFAPTVSVTNHQLVTPGMASLVLTTYAPSVTVGGGNGSHLKKKVRRLTMAVG